MTLGRQVRSPTLLQLTPNPAPRDFYHSDYEEFCSSLNGPYELQNVRMAAVSIAKFHDFQAEYEGSIPFTRSSTFSKVDAQ
jgi:hypothetical protein